MLSDQQGEGTEDMDFLSADWGVEAEILDATGGADRDFADFHRFYRSDQLVGRGFWAAVSAAGERTDIGTIARYGVLRAGYR